MVTLASPNFVAGEVVSRLQPLVDRGLVTRDVPLGPLTTLKVGGSTAWMSRPQNKADLLSITQACEELRVPILMFGWGSNILISDRGWPGMTIVLEGEFTQIVFRPDSVWAGAAVRLPNLARKCAQTGRAGLEFMVGIPGTVGGGVRMNAGGHGSDFASVLRSARVLDLDGTHPIETFTAERLEFGYRSSVLTDRHIVLSAELITTDAEPGDLGEKLREISSWRRHHQPGGTYNCGSVFKNPVTEPAGALIDRLGLKGLRVGNAQVSSKHANFISVTSPGSATDVLTLIRLVQQQVVEKTGIVLETEIKLYGFEEQRQ